MLRASPLLALSIACAPKGPPDVELMPSYSGASCIAAGPWRTCGRMPDGKLTCVGRSFVGREGGKPDTKVVTD